MQYSLGIRANRLVFTTFQAIYFAVSGKECPHASNVACQAKLSAALHYANSGSEAVVLPLPELISVSCLLSEPSRFKANDTGVAEWRGKNSMKEHKQNCMSEGRFYSMELYQFSLCLLQFGQMYKNGFQMEDPRQQLRPAETAGGGFRFMTKSDYVFLDKCPDYNLCWGGGVNKWKIRVLPCVNRTKILAWVSNGVSVPPIYVDI